MVLDSANCLWISQSWWNNQDKLWVILLESLGLGIHGFWPHFPASSLLESRGMPQVSDCTVPISCKLLQQCTPVTVPHSYCFHVFVLHRYYRPSTQQKYCWPSRRKSLHSPWYIFLLLYSNNPAKAASWKYVLWFTKLDASSTQNYCKVSFLECAQEQNDNRETPN